MREQLERFFFSVRGATILFVLTVGVATLIWRNQTWTPGLKTVIISALIAVNFMSIGLAYVRKQERLRLQEFYRTHSVTTKQEADPDTGKKIKVPKKQAIYAHWRAVWQVTLKMSADLTIPYTLNQVMKHLEEYHEDLVVSEDTLRKILRAGRAGDLDALPKI